MYNTLINAMNQKKIISIYSDDQDHFMVGYICKIINEKLIMLNIGVYGEFDGYSVILVDRILRVEIDSLYLKRIGLVSNAYIEDIDLDESENAFEAMLKYAEKKAWITAVRLENAETEIRGYIKCSDKTTVTISQINDFGEYDGETIFFMKDILKIVVNDVECALIDRIVKLKKANIGN